MCLKAVFMVETPKILVFTQLFKESKRMPRACYGTFFKINLFPIAIKYTSKQSLKRETTPITPTW